ncbi:hypothetical protein BOTBODRAFT_105153 [Botryobasidium botryosum FD-172 SS1]|uniref:SURF1-like protein n=1 Tax=Botryobasidium botryosum (strain FD-172 SS1) TaxID=930990 RepID=A0A067MQA4_BOTB1|nr:hypothetical protein BOTBODRAFT_105153 [Botryobasidium botryosum FD-172 SS1]
MQTAFRTQLNASLRTVLATSRSTPRVLRAARPLSWRAYASEAFDNESTPPFSGSSKPKSSWLTPTTLVLGFIPIFTFGLGTWQIQRLRWKVALIDELEEKVRREPMTLPKNIKISALPEFAFRKVLLRGTWDHAHTILVGPRTRENVLGYHVVTPLVRPDGASTVLVDRGFVAREFHEIPSEYISPTGDYREQAEVEVVGMLRNQQEKGTFTPENVPEKGEWYWMDVERIKEHAGGEAAGVQPVFIQEIFEGNSAEASHRVALGMPVGRSPEIDLRNQHATYAVTWYSLSAATAVMFFALMRKGRGNSSTAKFRGSTR